MKIRIDIIMNSGKVNTFQKYGVDKFVNIRHDGTEGSVIVGEADLAGYMRLPEVNRTEYYRYCPISKEETFRI